LERPGDRHKDDLRRVARIDFFALSESAETL